MADEQAGVTPGLDAGEQGSAGREPALPADGGELEALRTELEAARARLAELETEREAAQRVIAEAAAQLERARAEAAEARAAQLAAHRRAVLAENAGALVEELVAGETPEAIDASVETARAAYERVAEQLRQQAAATVPTGAGARGEPGGEQLSPLEKIARALGRDERR